MFNQDGEIVLLAIFEKPLSAPVTLTAVTAKKYVPSARLSTTTVVSNTPTMVRNCKFPEEVPA
jgi:hypothetical protein